MNLFHDELGSILEQQTTALRKRYGAPKPNEEPMCCPWHKKGINKHKTRFGLTCECLDCMEEIRSGRCEIDVKNFDFDTYWTVKRFWDKVEIRGQDECWPWKGTTKKAQGESVAYFPSPFHSGTTQSAPRVAFWTSRGYTGRLRIFHIEGCNSLCCNPLHLRVRELESIPVPTKIDKINFQYGNIFQRVKEAHLQGQSDSSELLPPA